MPALIGFFGVVWLLPVSGAGRPWHLARAAAGPAAGQPANEDAQAAGRGRRRAFPVGATPAAGHNFALAANGAAITGGQGPEELIDGNDAAYTGGTGFGYTVWNATPPQFFLLTLREPSTIDCIRFLLWDRDEGRYYRYKLEVCPDGKGEAWTCVADHTGPAEQCRSWQTVRLKAQQVKLVRLTGTYNSANSGFHVVELRASLGLPAGTPPPVAPEGLDF